LSLAAQGVGFGGSGVQGFRGSEVQRFSIQVPFGLEVIGHAVFRVDFSPSVLFNLEPLNAEPGTLEHFQLY